MNEFELQRVCKYHIYPRDSKLYSDRGFVIFDNGSMGGTYWTSLILKDNKSYYFDSFGGATDKFPLNQLPKPIVYHNYKIQDIKYELCGSFCIYFSYLIERMIYYDIIVKMYFG